MQGSAPATAFEFLLSLKQQGLFNMPAPLPLVRTRVSNTIGMDMKEINDEIKQTLNLMQTDIDYEAHGEMQKHLNGLLEIKRNELQQRLVERSWLDHADGMGSVVKFDQAPYKSVKLDGQVEAKTLSSDELLAGGWWCADVSAECEMAFKSRGFYVVRDGWGGIGGHIGDCCILGQHKHVSRAWIKSIVSGEKQIHRIGNEFYWSDK